MRNLTLIQPKIDAVESEPIQRLLIIDTDDDSVLQRFCTRYIPAEGAHSEHLGIIYPIKISTSQRLMGGVSTISSTSVKFVDDGVLKSTLKTYEKTRYIWKIQFGYLGVNTFEDDATWTDQAIFVMDSFKDVKLESDQGDFFTVPLRSRTFIQEKQKPDQNLSDILTNVIESNSEQPEPVAYGEFLHPEWSNDDDVQKVLRLSLIGVTGTFSDGEAVNLYNDNLDIVGTAHVTRYFEETNKIELEEQLGDVWGDLREWTKIKGSVWVGGFGYDFGHNFGLGAVSAGEADIESKQFYGIAFDSGVDVPERVITAFRTSNKTYFASKFPALSVESVSALSEELNTLVRVPRFRSDSNPYTAVLYGDQTTDFRTTDTLIKLKSGLLNTSRPPNVPGVLQLKNTNTSHVEYVAFDSIAETTTENVNYDVGDQLEVRYAVKFQGATDYEDWVYNGEKVRVSGNRIVGLKCELVGDTTYKQHIFYRLFEEHPPHFWTPWFKDGEECDITNGYVADAVEIKLVTKSELGYFVRYKVYERSTSGDAAEEWSDDCEDGETCGSALPSGEADGIYLDNIRIWVKQREVEDELRDKISYHLTNITERGLFGSSIVDIPFEYLEVRQLSYVARYSDTNGNFTVDIETQSERIYSANGASVSEWNDTELSLDNDSGTRAWTQSSPLLNSDDRELLRFEVTFLTHSEALQIGDQIEDPGLGPALTVTATDDSTFIEGYNIGTGSFSDGSIYEKFHASWQSQTISFLLNSQSVIAGGNRITAISTSSDPIPVFDTYRYYLRARAYPLATPPVDAPPSLPTIAGGTGSTEERIPSSHGSAGDVNVTSPANVYDDDFGTYASFSLTTGSTVSTIYRLFPDSDLTVPTWATKTFAKVYYDVVQDTGNDDQIDFDIQIDWWEGATLVGTIIHNPTELFTTSRGINIDITSITEFASQTMIGKTFTVTFNLDNSNGREYSFKVYEERFVFSNTNLDPTSKTGKMFLDVTARIAPDGFLLDTLQVQSVEIPITAEWKDFEIDFGSLLGSYLQGLRINEISVEIQSRTEQNLEGVCELSKHGHMFNGVGGERPSKLYISGEFTHDDYDAEITGLQGSLIDRPAHVIRHMLQKYVELDESFIDTARFDALSAVDDHKAAFQITDVKTMDEWLSKVAILDQLSVNFNNNKITLVKLNQEGNLTVNRSDLDISGIQTTSGSSKDIYAEVNVGYQYNPATGKELTSRGIVDHVREFYDVNRVYNGLGTLLTNHVGTVSDVTRQLLKIYGHRQVKLPLKGNMNLYKIEDWGIITLDAIEYLVIGQSFEMSSPHKMITLDCIRLNEGVGFGYNFGYDFGVGYRVVLD